MLSVAAERQLNLEIRCCDESARLCLKAASEALVRSLTIEERRELIETVRSLEFAPTPGAAGREAFVKSAAAHLNAVSLHEAFKELLERRKQELQG